MANNHPSRTVDIPGLGLAEIDKEMVSVITELNRLGFRTLQCCQGDDEWIRYIEFDMGAIECEFEDAEIDDDGRRKHKLRISVKGAAA